VGLKRLVWFVAFVLAAAVVLVPGAAAGNFDEQRMGCSGENPAVCPTGTTGQAYTLRFWLQGDEDASCAGYSISSGTAPPGLSVSGSNLTGVPTQAGTFDFFVTVTYACEFPKPASDDFFRIAINPALAKLTLGPEQASVTPATVGTSYSLQMIASVAEAKTWTINSGALPAGLTLDGSSGLISGTPTAAGTFTFEVLAKMNSDTRSDTKTLAITVRDPVAIAGSEPFTPDRRAQSEVSMPFDATLTATGGTSTYTWALTSGALPPGLLLENGAISGTPTTAGVYPFIASVTDTEGRVATYPGRIVVAEKLAISTLLLRPGKVGKLYAAKLKTLGGVKPATWRIVRGPLPRGVRFDRALGQLFGTPKRPGRYRVTFEATDTLGVTAKKTLLIAIAASPLPKKSR
jgi:large repetitive protein